MIVVADSGATKAQWRVIMPNGEVHAFETIGLNPYHSDKEEYLAALEGAFPFDPSKVKYLHFYGAGCGTDEKAEEAGNSLLSFFSNTIIATIYSDIMGAAHALFADSKGIVIILGTGANVGYYNGDWVEQATPSLGYILGDEGSGAYIGKEFVRMWLYDELPKRLLKKLDMQYGLNLSGVLNRVYTKPFPAQFLSNFVPFIAEHIHEPSMDNLVESAFKSFVNKHLIKQPRLHDCDIGVVGSVGYVFKDILERVLQQYGKRISVCVRYPIDRIVEYHMAERC